jgi:hypothetical protein
MDHLEMAERHAGSHGDKCNSEKEQSGFLHNLHGILLTASAIEIDARKS